MPYATTGRPADSGIDQYFLDGSNNGPMPEGLRLCNYPEVRTLFACWMETCTDLRTVIARRHSESRAASGSLVWHLFQNHDVSLSCSTMCSED